jgi:DNA-binding Lrp family transcriptional regulator
VSNKTKLDSINRNIINTLQYGFPISDHPYKEVAESLGIAEKELLQRLQFLLDNGLLTRFGPLFNAENMGGALSLCAMQIPKANFDSVAKQVNALPEVAHNYQRDHIMNMWFVLATKSLEEKHKTLQVIEQQTGYKVYDMPKEKEYFVGLFLQV